MTVRRSLTSPNSFAMNARLSLFKKSTTPLTLHEADIPSSTEIGWYTVNQICTRLMVNNDTVRKWCLSGQLKCWLFGASYMIKLADLRRFCKRQGRECPI